MRTEVKCMLASGRLGWNVRNMPLRTYRNSSLTFWMRFNDDMEPFVQLLYVH